MNDNLIRHAAKLALIVQGCELETCLFRAGPVDCNLCECWRNAQFHTDAISRAIEARTPPSISREATEREANNG